MNTCWSSRPFRRLDLSGRGFFLSTGVVREILLSVFATGLLNLLGEIQGETGNMLPANVVAVENINEAIRTQQRRPLNGCRLPPYSDYAERIRRSPSPLQPLRHELLPRRFSGLL